MSEVLKKTIDRLLAAPPPVDHSREEAERRQQMADRRERWQQFIVARGRRYEGCTLDSFECRAEQQAKAVEALRSYAVDIEARIKAGQNVVLFGPPGTGKDHLLVALSRCAFRAGFTVAWANGQEMFSALRDAISENQTERRTLMDFTSGQVQYFSDPVPPTGENGKYQKEILFRIIDRCYSNLRPVWVTLNVRNREEAAERMGTQSVDRLMHDALIVPCNWPSYRVMSKSA